MDNIIISTLAAFFAAILAGPVFIPLLRKFKFGQSIREEGPQSHLKKAGTPTMGGVIFIVSSLLVTAFAVRNPGDEAMIAMYALIAFGIIGAMDDSLKILRKKNLGLRAYQKMILLLAVSGIFGYYAANNSSIGTAVIIPFAGTTLELGIWYMPFIIFYFVSVTNAVNLTDGLDGLATTVTLVVMAFLTVVSFAMGHYTLAIFCAVVAGSLLGFLKFNAFPAQVFMGDTGSLALGGAVAAVAMILKLPLIILIAGAVYVLEALSVVLQVSSFKLTKKRIFKMAPIHHHFELSGWHETKVVSMFSIATAVLCLIALLAV
ncbi:MAG: phospho-N-acetylmuramoyl-pentapeptide-transferase [Firmicutes bacterium]|nr:phospho-N-acetylmuramoyl-pentapeptide-transferase [Bacillota bacterium]